MDKPRVLIAIPTYGSGPYASMVRFGMLCIQAERDVGLLGILASSMAYIHMARNSLVRAARKYDPCPTHLMFLDQDSIPTPDTISRLLSLDKPVVGAAYYQKHEPYRPVVYHIDPEFKMYDYDFPNPDENPEPFLVQGMGLGAMLIRMEVFDQLQEKFHDEMWFQCPVVTIQRNGETLDTLMGEDVFFCKRLNEAGIEIWCDPIDQVQHIGNLDVCGGLFRSVREQRLEEAKG